MSAIFITATGTDIGKTFVATGLIRHWRTAGHAVDALKPVATGFDPGTLFAEAIRSARQVVELGFSDIRQVGRILLTGAMVVVPVWLG